LIDAFPTPQNPMKKTLFSVLAIAAVTGSPAAVTVYKINPVHSSVILRVGHLGATNVYGRFNDVSGTVTFDEADPSKSTVDFTIKADSIDTNNVKRDQHLKSPDFLNAKQFPDITFKTTSVKKIDDKTYDVTGDLTIRGTTKPVTTKFAVIGSGKSPTGQEVSGGETVFTVKRSDYGSTFGNNGIVGDEVQVTVAVEGDKQK
jgi:polyisoprenoid-binding protein YceI